MYKYCTCRNVMDYIDGHSILDYLECLIYVKGKGLALNIFKGHPKNPCDREESALNSQA